MDKLTLNAEREVIKLAKKLAAERGTSVSAMFTEFVRSLARSRERTPHRPAPITRQRSGIIRVPPGKTDRELIEEALREPHGP